MGTEKKQFIGYHPGALMAHMAHKHEVGDLVIGNDNQELRDKLKAKSEEVILAKAGIKPGSKARVCLSSGISLVGGLSPTHDHDNPRQHVLAEVTSIDYWGQIHYIDENGKEGSTYMGMITLCDETP